MPATPAETRIGPFVIYTTDQEIAQLAAERLALRQRTGRLRSQSGYLMVLWQRVAWSLAGSPPPGADD